MTILLMTRRNVGLIALSYLLSLGHEVKLITDDKEVKWLAERLGVPEVTLETMGEFDYLFSVHWHKKVDMKYIPNNKGVNFHPMLFKYPGKSPIQFVIENKDVKGSVESHFMTNKFDEGEVIHQEFFNIPVCATFADYYNEAIVYYFKCLDRTLNKLIQ